MRTLPRMNASEPSHPIPVQTMRSLFPEAITSAMLSACGMHNLFKIIHENDSLLVIEKPAGLVCHPTKTDEYSSLISRVRLYLGPGAQPHLINRLDRETSGVTLVAKNDDAAREL